MVYNFGIYDVEKNSDNKKYYTKWRGMIARCYSIKDAEKYPTYTDCKICDEWKYFSNFLSWCKNYESVCSIDCADYALDKDLKGSGEYSPETCCLLPKSINTFLTIKRRRNASGLIGVSYQKYNGLFKAEINDFFNGERLFLGYYKTPEEAAKRYSLEKIKIAYGIEMKGLIDYDKTLEGLLVHKIEKLLEHQI